MTQSQPDAIDATTGAATGADPALAELEREGEIAADYIEELLDIADLGAAGHRRPRRRHRHGRRG
jgi:hypothetical protein